MYCVIIGISFYIMLLLVLTCKQHFKGALCSFAKYIESEEKHSN